MVAWLALFVALGGVASGLPGRNSVDSGDIVNERVRAKDIRGGGVRSSELRDGAVHEADIAGGAVATAQLADGAVTPVKLGPVPAVRVDTPQEAPGCSSQAIASSSTEVVQFSFELYDTQNLHPDPPADCSPSGQSRLTAPIDGIYEVSAGVSWSSDPDGRRQIEIVRTTGGSSQTVASDARAALADGGVSQTVNSMIPLAAGDDVALEATQTAGNALTLGSGLDAFFGATWLAPIP